MHKQADILDSVFERFSENSDLFKDRDVVRHDYIPESLPHREEQIKCLGMIVAPLLKTTRCSNIFVYGKTGTGKTAVTKHVLRRLAQKAAEFGAPIQIAHVNCRITETEYRILVRICEVLDVHIPFTGLAVGEVFDRFRKSLDAKRISLVIVLDEIDELVKTKGDTLLYELTRINESLSQSAVNVVGISNDLHFKELLDPRALSSLSEEEIVFGPYDASELRDILWERAKLAFFDGVLSDGAVSLCAALAAAEHGDARRALDLLRVAGEVAERENSTEIIETHVRAAEKRIENDRMINALLNLTTHSKLVLYSVYLLGKAHIHSVITGDIYEVYTELCGQIGMVPLTQRRVSGLINELDSIGLLNARLISRGRYGRTKKISLRVPRTPFNKVFGNDYHLGELNNFMPDCLTHIRG